MFTQSLIVDMCRKVTRVVYAINPKGGTVGGRENGVEHIHPAIRFWGSVADKSAPTLPSGA
ncbi:MAG TPA: hypothetical protein VFB12_01060 [Ktedonobacteraceae bacterium]|nr:hypothetical protein [Ktedonobacteraceae bacterium]